MSRREGELESQLAATTAELANATRDRDRAESDLRRLQFPPYRPFLADDRPRDFRGRGLPRRVDAALLLRAIPGLASQFAKRVPDEFWVRDVDGAASVATIACPCGGEPNPEPGELFECDCGRIYLFTGERVHVGYGEDFEGVQDDPKEVDPPVEPEPPVE